MARYRQRLGDILVSKKLLTQEQLATALATQRKTALPLGRQLVALGMVTEDLLLRAIASQQAAAVWHLDQDPPTEEALALLPLALCRQYQMLPVEVRGGVLVLAMRNAMDINAIDAARNVSGLRIQPVLASEDRLAAMLEAPIERARRAAEGDELVARALGEIEQSGALDRPPEQITEADTRPVVGLVNQLIVDAIRMGASDIHLEPGARGVEVRYRLDGQLVPIRSLPAALMRVVATRVKIMAEIDIVEFRVPQDGRIGVEIDGRNVDLRVGVLPSYYGPRIVLRVLDRAAALKSLDDVGFGDVNLAMFRRLIQRPYGLMLMTGPTGSGKTTTLYAALSELKQPTRNIMTCEDPVEYDVPGISQSQVNEKVGLTFAKQLRAILRQDPDVILVGEIRDREKAETALRAAITGHLVLSTLHTNDAPASIPRLVDMGIDPSLIASALVGVVGQRLLRRLCPRCRSASRPTAAEAAVFAHYGVPIDKVGRAEGCESCAGTGFAGRFAVHEVMACTPDTARAIAGGAFVAQFREAAGYRPLQEDALERVAQGETTLEEASRLIAFDAVLQPPLRLAA